MAGLQPVDHAQESRHDPHRHPVAVRQGDVLAVSFHPELNGETRLHEWLLGRIAANTKTGGEAQ